MQNFYSSEIRAGKAVTHKGVRILPFSRVTRLQFPGFASRIQWSRPASVLVIGQDKNGEVLPIKDTTRRLQLGILAIGAISALLFWLVSSGRQDKEIEHG